MFVILITKLDDPTKSVEYVGIDSQTGYPYWTTYLGNARFFDSVASAEEFLGSSDFTKDSETTDGTVYPPRMIHTGLGLNNTKHFRQGLISIVRVVLSTVEQSLVSGRIKYANSRKTKIGA